MIRRTMEIIEEISPKDDVMFHLLFGKKGNEDLLKDLLEGILEVEIEEIDLDTENIMIGDTVEEKVGILDVRAKINGGEQVNIEMQIRNSCNMIKRTLYYVSKMYANQLKKGEGYDKLKRTIAINILDYELVDTKRYHSIWRLREEKEREKVLTDDIEIHIIELPKFRKKGKGCEKKIEQWLYFIDNKDKEMIEMSVIANESVARAKSQVKITRSYSDIVRRQRLEIARLDRITEENAIKREKAEIRQERKEIKQDRKEIKQDRKEIKQDRKEIKQREKKLKQDKRKIEADKEKIKQDRNKINKERKKIEEFCKVHNIMLDDIE